jgi:hypothetical protein
MDIYPRLRTWLVRVVAGIMALSTAASTIESYMGLRAWAAGHGYVGAGSYIFPGFIDAFPLAAECVLIIAYIDGWKGRARVMPWCVLTGGLVVSVGLQVGQVVSPDVWTKSTHGTPPMAAWLSLLVGMAMFKRVMANRPEAVPEAEIVSDAEPLAEWERELLEDPDELEPVATGPDFELAAETFADDLKAGRVPGLNRIRSTMHVGHRAAPQIQSHLRELAGARS